MGTCCSRKCWVHIDWHCEHAGLVRVYSEDAKFGDPYCYAIPFKRIGYDEIEFIGMVKNIKLCQWRAIRRELKAAHIKAIRTRVRDGQLHRRTMRNDLYGED